MLYLQVVHQTIYPEKTVDISFGVQLWWQIVYMEVWALDGELLFSQSLEFKSSEQLLLALQVHVLIDTQSQAASCGLFVVIKVIPERTLSLLTKRNLL